ncbi:hypothetical protein [uncultured Tenacibaculum sp.]|uniref:hypothetical protein n=1 Tax=uncultured Tenacibaculum sp. TaxID=174713 RepID=UPI002603D1D8|nr:hypothetical protein [uncultured Tenacibaculum sp.]
MKKSILNLGQKLSKESQKQINGGASCPTYPASQCMACGGFPLSNGCCLGTAQTHACLTGILD